MAKYFTDKEVKGLKPWLVVMLDAARGMPEIIRLGITFVILSGLRSVEQNAAAGGAPKSAHLSGEAVDLKCTDPFVRFQMIEALRAAGFVRIEVSKDGHIHVDIGTAAEGFPQDWFEIE